MTRNTRIHTCVNVHILLHLVRHRCIFKRVQIYSAMYSFTCALLHTCVKFIYMFNLHTYVKVSMLIALLKHIFQWKKNKTRPVNITNIYWTKSSSEPMGNSQSNYNKNQKWDPLRSMKTFIRRKMGHTTSFRLLKPHQWPFNHPATKARGNILHKPLKTIYL